MARPFDPDTRQVTGEAVLVADNIGLEASRYASFSISDAGVLVYGTPLSQSPGQLTWIDGAGGHREPVGDVATYVGPSLSRGDTPDIAVRIFRGGPEVSDLVILDAKGKPRRLTFGAGGSGAPIWSPDGLRVAFMATRQGAATLRQRLASGGGEEQELLDIGGFIVPTDWSADGKFIAFNRLGADGSSDIGVLALAEHRVSPFAQTSRDEAYATFSPNGDWIAYQETAEDARTEVYVRSFPPGSGEPYQISPHGGSVPKWSNNGKEIFFIAPNGTMMAVSIDAPRRAELGSPGTPRTLFKMPALVSRAGRPYDVSDDGKRFLVSVPTEQAPPASITVVVNWLATIQH
jgi:dipeptidyl aminopeptidase/acylaminoacyl peptidase